MARWLSDLTGLFPRKINCCSHPKVLSGLFVGVTAGGYEDGAVAGNGGRLARIIFFILSHLG